MRGAVFPFLPASALLAACATGPAPDSLAPAPRPEAAHYDIDARFGEGHTIDARVTVTLPADIADDAPAFFLGGRFDVEVETSAPAAITIEPTDKPVAGINLITVDLDGPAQGPVDVTFRYSGPLNQEDENAYTVATDDQIELRLDTMWHPVYSDINLRYTLDATFEGVPADFVAVSQGEVVQEGETVRVHREMIDVDTPFVATRGLTRAAGPGVEVYAADFDWIITDIMRRHALASAAYFQDWFGPLPAGDVRLVILPKGSGGYARRGYVVTGEAREAVAEGEEIPQWGPARHIAHEFAHAWWSPADPLTDNYWLTESAAEYLAVRYIEHAFGLLTAHMILESKRERAENSGPLLGEGRPSGHALYQRGPFLLFDLEEEIGREALDAVFARLSRNPPSLTAEFMAALTDIAGPEAAAYFEEKLRAGPGPWAEEEDEDEEDTGVQE